MHDDSTLQTLLAPVSDDAPAGPDLEYDPDFLRLEREAAIRAERSLGDSVIAAEEPDWDRVQTLALELSRRSRDLRVAGRLGAACLRLRGLPGWADTLALIHGLLEQHWDSVHPQLDADDDNDPTSRVNALVGLSDPMGLLGALRTTAFVQSPRLGRFSLRDLRVANGSIKLADGQSGPSLAEIEACCLDCAPETLAASAQAITDALTRTRAIDALLTERLGIAAPDLRALLTDLRELERFVLPQWQARDGDAPTDMLEAHAAPAGEGSATVAGSARPPGAIAGPDDVLRRLDEICAYYARCEPSSPVPMLLRRAQRLVGCDFLALMKELAPAGIDDLQRVTGPLDNG
ncbi:type VI secretion system protein TssA [Xanthomonas cassavae CFBP 4642]|uniref:Type VI secretion system protein TssA n=1 Tax=Xanthomonas cassavae CFBP 4642 TaxID=1219375 RepID=A0ABS8HC73_9XANT|nr:type VI secretion system protein TssA [Xanthomonas cassavae]MCC4619242.1 type VI secretion system protein TssA [Xanthomonas cassavae CFBP 4642]